MRPLFKVNSLSARLIKGLGAQGFGKAVQTLERLIEVPLLLGFWGAQMYGEWLLLAAIPTYLAVSDGGFTQAAIREMSVHGAAGDREGAVSIFQSIQALLFFVTVIAFLSSLILVPCLPLERWFGFRALDARTSVAVIQIFVLDVLLGFYQGLLSGSFWCSGKYPLGMFLGNLMQLMEYLGFIFVVWMGGGVVASALALLVGRVLGIVVLAVALRKAIPWLTYGIDHVSLDQIKQLAKPAFSSLAFPLGNALNIQGLSMIVGATLGPVSVVVFSTLRTLSRLTMQARVMINQVIQPELSAAFGKNDTVLFGRIFIHSSQLVLWLIGPISMFMAFFGDLLLRFWTSGQVEMEWGLYLALLLANLINASWYTAMMVMISTNRHEKVAVVYTLVYGLATFALAYYASLALGISGLSVALIISEVLMAIYIVPVAVKLAGTSFGEWLRGVASPPIFILHNFVKGTKTEVLSK